VTGMPALGLLVALLAGTLTPRPVAAPAPVPA
jgi:hypothetical protein